MAGQRQVLHDLCAPRLADYRAQHHSGSGRSTYPPRSIRGVPSVWILKKRKDSGEFICKGIPFWCIVYMSVDFLQHLYHKTVL